MRRGVLEYVVALLVIFVFFVWLLFLIIGYANVGRIQSKLDAMAFQGSRMLSVGDGTDDVAAMVNKLKPAYAQDISSGDVAGGCTAGSREVSLTVQADYNATVLGTKTITSRSSAYNEASEQNCNYTITLVPAP